MYTHIIIKHIHRNGENQDHAGKRFLKTLREDIGMLEKGGYIVSKIQATLDQNYSPCNNYNKIKPDCRSGCADDIIAFKKELRKENIKFCLTIRFANFYGLHLDSANRSGLIKLLENNVVLQLLSGEEVWEKFADMESGERKNREDIDKKLLEMIEDEASDKCHYNWSKFFWNNGHKKKEIHKTKYIISEKDEGTSSATSQDAGGEEEEASQRSDEDKVKEVTAVEEMTGSDEKEGKDAKEDENEVQGSDDEDSDADETDQSEE